MPCCLGAARAPAHPARLIHGCSLLPRAIFILMTTHQIISKAISDSHVLSIAMAIALFVCRDDPHSPSPPTNTALSHIALFFSPYKCRALLHCSLPSFHQHLTVPVVRFFNYQPFRSFVRITQTHLPTCHPLYSVLFSSTFLRQR
jgi:hypothetical protein